MTNSVVTFGCRLNSYESEVMKNLLQQAGKENTIIVNTCAVTKEAERQSKQMIRKLKRENPHMKLIVTGCSAQINPDQFLNMEEVDQVIGNEEKLKAESYGKTDRVLVNDIMSVKETAGHLVSGFEGKARAFVQVQNGCNHRCTFCTIPYGRGNSRSVPVQDVIEQAQLLTQSGYQEIVITGVDITDYGQDFETKIPLGLMLKELLKAVPDLKRLRLSSLDPVEIDNDLWDLIAHEPRLMPHLHLSLQAGDDLTLKRMKRRHLRNDALNFCKKAKQLRPDVVFGADIIAGFPTETDEMFDNTRRFVADAGLTFLHVFPYSPRPGTPAARMPQVDRTIVKRRASFLREEGEKALASLFESLQGKTLSILIESVDDGKIIGKTDHFVPVILVLDTVPEIGTVYEGVIFGSTQKFLLAKPVSSSI
ncbi:MAG: Threonylcarbamoyladenosine tRNA methylthiotransferase MtaB [Holosporales bacterium]